VPKLTVLAASVVALVVLTGCAGGGQSARFGEQQRVHATSSGGTNATVEVTVDTPVAVDGGFTVGYTARLVDGDYSATDISSLGTTQFTAALESGDTANAQLIGDDGCEAFDSEDAAALAGGAPVTSCLLFTTSSPVDEIVWGAPSISAVTAGTGTHWGE
jgi:hypothetical protein